MKQNVYLKLNKLLAEEEAENGIRFNLETNTGF